MSTTTRRRHHREDTPDLVEDEMEKEKGMQSRVEAVLWITASLVALFYFDVIKIVVEDGRVYRTWLTIGTVQFLVFFSIGVFFGVIRPFFMNVQEEEYPPYVIGVATACMVGSFFCYMIALWPVFSIATPVLLFVLCLGLLNTLNFAP